MGQPNYHVAQGWSVGSLIKECQMMVEQGWVPTGGVCMVIDHQRGQHIYSQAFYFAAKIRAME